MGVVLGVHLLPSTGEFTYDTVAHQGAASGGALAGAQHLLRAGRIEDRLFLCDRPIAGRASRMHDGLGRLRLVRQFARRRELPNLSLDELHRRVVSAMERQRLCRRQLARVGPDAIVERPHSPSRRCRAAARLRRHAVRSEHRALHPRFEGARLQGRLLSVHLDDRVGLSLARAHHLLRRTSARRRRARSTPFSARRRRRSSRRIRSI